MSITRSLPNHEVACPFAFRMVPIVPSVGWSTENAIVRVNVRRDGRADARTKRIVRAIFI